MLAVARRMAPHLTWLTGDLATVHLGERASYDVVLLAGNVVPLVEEGTLERAVANCAAHVAPGGVLVAGFGLDRAHLPRTCPVTPWEEYDAAARAAGLVTEARYSTWDGDPPERDPGYCVTVHRRPR